MCIGTSAQHAAALVSLRHCVRQAGSSPHFCPRPRILHLNDHVLIPRRHILHALQAGASRVLPVYDIPGTCPKQAVVYAGAASTRVGNELGRGEPKRARRAVHTVIVLEMALMGLVVAVGFAVRYVWGRLFTDDPEVTYTEQSLKSGAMQTRCLTRAECWCAHRPDDPSDGPIMKCACFVGGAGRLKCLVRCSTGA